MDSAALENEALRKAVEFGHFEVVLLLLQDSRVTGLEKTELSVRLCKKATLGRDE